MSRVKRGKAHLKRRKNILKHTHGYHMGRKNLLKQAKTAILKAGVNAYRDRRLKKRAKRSLWQIKINAASREHGLSYSKFMHALKTKNIALDRKVLAELAEKHPAVFQKVMEAVR